MHRKDSEPRADLWSGLRGDSQGPDMHSSQQQPVVVTLPFRRLSNFRLPTGSPPAGVLSWAVAPGLPGRSEFPFPSTWRGVSSHELALPPRGAGGGRYRLIISLREPEPESPELLLRESYEEISCLVEGLGLFCVSQSTELRADWRKL